MEAKKGYHQRENEAVEKISVRTVPVWCSLFLSFLPCPRNPIAPRGIATQTRQSILARFTQRRSRSIVQHQLPFDRQPRITITWQVCAVGKLEPEGGGPTGARRREEFNRCAASSVPPFGCIFQCNLQQRASFSWCNELFGRTAVSTFIADRRRTVRRHSFISQSFALLCSQRLWFEIVFLQRPRNSLRFKRGQLFSFQIIINHRSGMFRRALILELIDGPMCARMFGRGSQTTSQGTDLRSELEPGESHPRGRETTATEHARSATGVALLCKAVRPATPMHPRRGRLP